MFRPHNDGWLMLNSFDVEKMSLEEIYRFPNQPVQVTGNYYWNILNLFSEVKKTMHSSIQQDHTRVESMSIDTSLYLCITKI
ncbi:hypothetical protein [Gracilibacillus orientalis]|nr:hypothetical protein [Gracilibacillus orientalis]